MSHKILLLEDDDSLNHAVNLKLKKEGYTVYSAFTVEEALRFYQSKNLSLIICDITLPDGSGLDFCSRVRKESDVLFLFLTALDREEDIMTGYRQGADDYITKPFSLPVLVSKVGVLLKRFPTDNPKSIVSGNLILYPDEKRATKNGAKLNLTAKEYSLLSFFMENPMRILSKNQLLESIWDIEGNFVDENTLSVNIRRLREKIEDNPSVPVLLKNIRGLGYIWERKCEKE